MNNWKSISSFIKFSTKGITPSYVNHSSIIVLNQKCIRNNKIDYSFAQYTDDKKNISADKFVNSGDILVNSTGTGTAGRCAFVSKIPEGYKLIVDSHILILRCSSYEEAQCLSYAISSFEKTLMSFMTGSSGQSELDKVVLLNIKTKMSDRREDQKKISSVLSALNTKIELNNRINVELEKMAKTLYDYWFVQFDFSDKNGKPYKSSGGEMVWSEELKREIPEGWVAKKIGDIFEVKRGQNITRKTIQKGVVPVIAAGLEPSCYHNTANTKGPIVTISGSGANAGYTQLHNQDIWASDCSYVDITTTKYVYIAYLFLKNRQKEIYDMQKGSAQPHVYPNDIMGLGIAMDSTFCIFDKYLDIVKPQFELIGKLKMENQKLAELRNWLLPMLMNGQVRVK